MSHQLRTALAALVLPCIAGMAHAAPPDRAKGRVDSTCVTVLPASPHRLAVPQFDRGAVDPAMRMEYMMIITRPSPAQQADLNQLLSDQHNPSSANFHKWLTPEQFGDRFGLSTGDHSKIVAWLSSQGFEVKDSGRARNWVMFSGTAGQVQTALHTRIHHYQVDGEQHFANATPVSVPESLAPVIGGITGLHDFKPKPTLVAASPDFTSGTAHFLAPADFYTIYDVKSIAAAGIDGTGVNIGIVGTTQIQTSDIDTFRSKYNLPPNDPTTVLIGTNPGVNSSSLVEADLDIEWSNAVAPGASVYFYYSSSLTNAITGAINANIVHLISISFGGAEIDNSALSFEPILQQANAQGISVFASAGDNGAGGAPPDSGTFYRFGPAVNWPASYPEITAVGGTQFNDTTGTWWATTNDSNAGSALTYIPEIAWSGGGGGASEIFSKPVWQSAPGVPQDGARDLPDVSLSASTHDAYEIVTGGNSTAVGGTSASSPSMAGIVALLNQYLVANGQLALPGLGNINPQLYRMAQAFPNAYHDITSGGNTDFCRQGSTGCVTGAFGFTAGPGYDLATGIGTIDVNNFITQWPNTSNAVNVTFSINPAQATFNDTLQLIATVTSASGSGTPSGVVDFSSNGTVALGSAPLDSTGNATLSAPGYLFGTASTFTVTARYSGDTAFSGGGATTKVKITAPTGVSSIVPSVPVSVTSAQDTSGVFWEFTMSLLERGGVAAVLTGVSLDGQTQPVSQFFPSPSIPANGSIASSKIIFRNLASPVVRTFVFTGIDANGQSWSRQATITFLPQRTTLQAVILTANPLVMPQDTSADPSCQWSQQLVLTDYTGYPQTITDLQLSNVSISDRIPSMFGTTQLAAFGSLQGKLCWTGETTGATETVTAFFASGFTQDIAVAFSGPLANPSAISVSPAMVNLTSGSPQASFNISVPDGQSWTIGINPQNITSGWLSLSQSAGNGSAQITVTASGNNFAPGAYPANLVIQGPNLWPAAVTVPITFVNGNSTGVTITNLINAASGQSVAAPGMLAVLQGTGLYTAKTTFTVTNASGGTAYGFFPNSISVTVNGVPAAIHIASPTQIQFQIPYETTVGTAIVGISYSGLVAGYVFQVAPSAPGLFADANGNVGPVQVGKTIALTMTGDGVTSPTIGDGSAAAGSLVDKPAMPFALTIGGVPAFLASYGMASGSYSTTTLNVTIPAGTPPGVQPVVVTVGGVSSPPVNLTITP